MTDVIQEYWDIEALRQQLVDSNTYIDVLFAQKVELKKQLAKKEVEIERLRKENREYLTEIINWKEEARLAHERGTGTTAKAG